MRKISSFWVCAIMLLAATAGFAADKKFCFQQVGSEDSGFLLNFYQKPSDYVPSDTSEACFEYWFEDDGQGGSTGNDAYTRITSWFENNMSAVVLTSDIEFAGHSGDACNDGELAFSGKSIYLNEGRSITSGDGGPYTISGLCHVTGSETNVGFATVEPMSTGIRNVNFDNAYFKSTAENSYVGIIPYIDDNANALPQYNVSNSEFYGTYAGALAGYLGENSLDIEGVSVTDVTVNGAYAGGFFGEVHGVSINSINGSGITVMTVAVQDSGRAAYGGGFAGVLGLPAGGKVNGVHLQTVSVSSSIENVDAHAYLGGIAGKLAQDVGGFEAVSDTVTGLTITDGLASGGFFGASEYVGPTYSASSSAYEGGYVEGSVEASDYVGGVVGRASEGNQGSSMNFSVKKMAVRTGVNATAASSYAGGLVGYLYNNEGNGSLRIGLSIRHTYSVGDVTGSGTLGYLVGGLDSAGTTFHSVQYNYHYGTDDAGASKGIGTFSDAGWLNPEINYNNASYNYVNRNIRNSVTGLDADGDLQLGTTPVKSSERSYYNGTVAGGQMMTVKMAAVLNAYGYFYESGEIIWSFADGQNDNLPFFANADYGPIYLVSFDIGSVESLADEDKVETLHAALDAGTYTEEYCGSGCDGIVLYTDYTGRLIEADLNFMQGLTDGESFWKGDNALSSSTVYSSTDHYVYRSIVTLKVAYHLCTLSDDLGNCYSNDNEFEIKEGADLDALGYGAGFLFAPVKQFATNEMDILFTPVLVTQEATVKTMMPTRFRINAKDENDNPVTGTVDSKYFSDLPESITLHDYVGTYNDTLHLIYFVENANEAYIHVENGNDENGFVFSPYAYNVEGSWGFSLINTNIYSESSEVPFTTGFTVSSAELGYEIEHYTLEFGLTELMNADAGVLTATTNYLMTSEELKSQYGSTVWKKENLTPADTVRFDSVYVGLLALTQNEVDAGSFTVKVTPTYKLIDYNVTFDLNRPETLTDESIIFFGSNWSAQKTLNIEDGVMSKVYTTECPSFGGWSWAADVSGVGANVPYAWNLNTEFLNYAEIVDNDGAHSTTAYGYWISGNSCNGGEAIYVYYNAVEEGEPVEDMSYFHGSVALRQYYDDENYIDHPIKKVLNQNMGYMYGYALLPVADDTMTFKVMAIPDLGYTIQNIEWSKEDNPDYVDEIAETDAGVTLGFNAPEGGDTTLTVNTQLLSQLQFNVTFGYESYNVEFVRPTVSAPKNGETPVEYFVEDASLNENWPDSKTYNVNSEDRSMPGLYALDGCIGWSRSNLYDGSDSVFTSFTLNAMSSLETESSLFATYYTSAQRLDCTAPETATITLHTDGNGTLELWQIVGVKDEDAGTDADTIRHTFVLDADAGDDTDRVYTLQLPKVQDAQGNVKPFTFEVHAVPSASAYFLSELLYYDADDGEMATTSLSDGATFVMNGLDKVFRMEFTSFGPYYVSYELNIGEEDSANIYLPLAAPKAESFTGDAAFNDRTGSTENTIPLWAPVRTESNVCFMGWSKDANVDEGRGTVFSSLTASILYALSNNEEEPTTLYAVWGACAAEKSVALTLKDETEHATVVLYQVFGSDTLFHTVSAEGIELAEGSYSLFLDESRTVASSGYELDLDELSLSYSYTPYDGGESVGPVDVEKVNGYWNVSGADDGRPVYSFTATLNTAVYNIVFDVNGADNVFYGTDWTFEKDGVTVNTPAEDASFPANLKRTDACFGGWSLDPDHNNGLYARFDSELAGRLDESPATTLEVEVEGETVEKLVHRLYAHWETEDCAQSTYTLTTDIPETQGHFELVEVAGDTTVAHVLDESMTLVKSDNVEFRITFVANPGYSVAADAEITVTYDASAERGVHTFANGGLYHFNDSVGVDAAVITVAGLSLDSYTIALSENVGNAADKAFFGIAEGDDGIAEQVTVGENGDWLLTSSYSIENSGLFKADIYRAGKCLAGYTFDKNDTASGIYTSFTEQFIEKFEELELDRSATTTLYAYWVDCDNTTYTVTSVDVEGGDLDSLNLLQKFAVGEDTLIRSYSIGRTGLAVPLATGASSIEGIFFQGAEYYMPSGNLVFNKYGHYQYKTEESENWGDIDFDGTGVYRLGFMVTADMQIKAPLVANSATVVFNTHSDGAKVFFGSGWEWNRVYRLTTPDATASLPDETVVGRADACLGDEYGTWGYYAGEDLKAQDSVNVATLQALGEADDPKYNMYAVWTTATNDNPETATCEPGTYRISLDESVTGTLTLVQMVGDSVYEHAVGADGLDVPSSVVGLKFTVRYDDDFEHTVSTGKPIVVTMEESVDSIEVGGEFEVTGNVTLSVKNTVDTYEIVFDENAGDGTVFYGTEWFDEKTYDMGVADETRAFPTSIYRTDACLSGFAFSARAAAGSAIAEGDIQASNAGTVFREIDSDFIDAYKSSQRVSPVTLYAVWDNSCQRNTYTVTVSNAPEEGSFTLGNSVGAYGNAFPVEKSGLVVPAEGDLEFTVNFVPSSSYDFNGYVAVGTSETERIENNSVIGISHDLNLKAYTSLHTVEIALDPDAGNVFYGNRFSFKWNGTEYGAALPVNLYRTDATLAGWTFALPGETGTAGGNGQYFTGCKVVSEDPLTMEEVTPEYSNITMVTFANGSLTMVQKMLFNTEAMAREACADVKSENAEEGVTIDCDANSVTQSFTAEATDYMYNQTVEMMKEDCESNSAYEYDSGIQVAEGDNVQQGGLSTGYVPSAHTVFDNAFMDDYSAYTRYYGVEPTTLKAVWKQVTVPTFAVVSNSTGEGKFTLTQTVDGKSFTFDVNDSLMVPSVGVAFGFRVDFDVDQTRSLAKEDQIKLAVNGSTLYVANGSMVSLAGAAVLEANTYFKGIHLVFDVGNAKPFYGSDWSLEGDYTVEAGKSTALPAVVYTSDRCLAGWTVEPNDTVAYVDFDENLMNVLGDIPGVLEKKTATLYASWSDDVWACRGGFMRLEVAQENGTVSLFDSIGAESHEFLRNAVILPYELDGSGLALRSVPDSSYVLDSLVLVYGEPYYDMQRLEEGVAEPYFETEQLGRVVLHEGEHLPERLEGARMTAFFGKANKTPVEIVKSDFRQSGRAFNVSFAASEFEVTRGVSAMVQVLDADGKVVIDTLLGDSVASAFSESLTLRVGRSGGYRVVTTLFDALDTARDTTRFMVDGAIASIAADSWQMLSLAAVDTSAVVWDDDPRFYWWDESGHGEYWQYKLFEQGDSIEGTRGFWYSSLEGRPLTLLENVDDEGDDVVWQLDSVYSGWNLVANPHGWSVNLYGANPHAEVDVDEDAEVTFWRYNVETADYEQVKHLDAYEAVWAKVGKATEWVMPATPDFESEDWGVVEGEPLESDPDDRDSVGQRVMQKKRYVLAKALSREHWTLQAMLYDNGGKRDAWNIFGAGHNPFNAEEPPASMGDHVNLSIIDGKRALAKSIRTASDEMEWKLSLSASSERTGYLKLAGIEGVRGFGYHVYVTVDGNTVEMNEGDSLKVRLGAVAKTATVCVAPAARTVVQKSLKGLRSARLGDKLQVTFDATGLAGTKARVDLLDMKGHVMATVLGRTVEGTNALVLDAPQSGLYMLRVRAGSSQQATKVMVK